MPPVAIGVDVGGTKVLAGAVDLAEPTALRHTHRAPTPRGAEALADAIVAAAEAVLADRRAAGEAAPVAVGVGLPGLVDRDGRLHTAPNLPGVVELALGPRLAELGLPAVVDNDANCATWAEVVVGAGRGSTDAVMVTLGTGIGGGVVLGGRLHHGAHGFAGEPGHMVVDPTGPVCPCGRRGCWERYASGHGLARLGQLAARAGRAPGVLAQAGGDPGAVAGEHVVAAARAGDAGALAVVEEMAGWLALGLANLADVFDPDLLLVGGGLADEADLFLDATRAAFSAEVLGGAHRVGTRIERATLGSDAGAIGAALLALGVPAGGGRAVPG